MSHGTRSLRCVRGWALAAAWLPLFLTAGSTAAAPFSGGVGYDYWAGPSGRSSRGPLGIASLDIAETKATVAIGRFDDSEFGRGWSGTTGLAAPVTRTASLQLLGARSFGDGTYRSWRGKAGPQIRLPMGQTVGVYYAHFEDNASSLSNGGGVEVGFPMGPTVGALAGASYANLQYGLTNVQGTLDLTWNARSNVQLIGEVGLGKNVSAISGAAAGGGSPSPISGSGRGGMRPSGGTTSTQSDFHASALVGVRLVIP